MKLKLLKPHTHGGVDYAPGDIVDIEDEKSADWLIDQGVAVDAEDDDPEPAE